MSKVVIIGCGNVGMAYAYSLINQNINVNELVLIDIDREKILGEVMDLSHAITALSRNINIKVGEYKDCSNAEIIVLSAGSNQEKGETRIDLINKNNSVFKDIIPKVMESGFSGIFLVATNPVDIMCYFARKYSNLPSNKIIGSGTILDSSRLRYFLSNKLQVSSKNIHADLIGEHGDSGFIVWSKATAQMVPILSIISKHDIEIIENEVRNSAYKIINYKGETSYGIGACLTKLTNAILSNSNEIYTVSAPVEDIYIGMPCVINKDGIKGVMRLSLTEEEKNKLEKSKQTLRTAINNMEVD